MKAEPGPGPPTPTTIDVDALCDQAYALRQAGQWPQAEALQRQAIDSSPQRARPYYELASLLHFIGRLEEAAPLYEKVRLLAPEHRKTTLDLALCYLALGDYPRGWPLFESRIGFPGSNANRLHLPWWNGEDLRGRQLLVWLEQGYGDLIMCARFLPLLAKMGADVAVVLPAPLMRLAEPLGIRRIQYQKALGLPYFDFHTLPFSIPYR